ncbi:MAG TPA: 1,4-alpha-glucan branching enzyme, partial [Acidimicrobiia bacterium]
MTNPTDPTPTDSAAARPTADPVAQEVSLLLAGEHGDPHHVLGLHPEKDGTVIRAYRPEAEYMAVILPDGQRVDMHQRYAAGLFQTRVPDKVDDYRFEVRYPAGATFTVDDPYRFWPTLGELDLHLIGEGR